MLKLATATVDIKNLDRWYTVTILVARTYDHPSDYVLFFALNNLCCVSLHPMDFEHGSLLSKDYGKRSRFPVK